MGVGFSLAAHPIDKAIGVDRGFQGKGTQLCHHFLSMFRPDEGGWSVLLQVLDQARAKGLRAAHRRHEGDDASPHGRWGGAPRDLHALGHFGKQLDHDLGLLLDQRLQRGQRQRANLRILNRVGSRRAGLAQHQRALAQKAAGLKLSDRHGRVISQLTRNAHQPANDHEEGIGRISLPVKQLAAPKMTPVEQVRNGSNESVLP